MSVRQKFRTDEGRPPVPTVEQIRERTGPAADFDWGFTLPPMTMRQIAEQEPAEWETAPAAALPMDPVALIQHAWRMAVAPLKDLLAEPLPGTNWVAKYRAEFAEETGAVSS